MLIDTISWLIKTLFTPDNDIGGINDAVSII